MEAISHETWSGAVEEGTIFPVPEVFFCIAAQCIAAVFGQIFILSNQHQHSCMLEIEIEGVTSPQCTV